MGGDDKLQRASFWKGQIMKTLLLTGLVVLSTAGMALVRGGTAENPQDGDKLITVRSENPEIVTVSDLYSYSGPKCTGTKTTHLAKGNANDDVHIAPYGSKNFYLGQCQSYTISFMYQGKEVEMDVDWAENTIKQSRACFDSNFGGFFAVDYDSSGGEGPLPPLEVPQLIAGGAGHIEGGAYDWITFYNTTASGGMIERDAVGNPISPVLPDGSLVTAVFSYDVVTFEVSEGDNCPPADLTGNCFVDYEDFALMANQWLTTDPCIPDDMVQIPAGTFEMGDSFSEGYSHERPVHTVTVDSFYMGRCEITNGQYCDYLNSALSQGLITVTSGVVYKAGSGTSYLYCDTSTSSSYSQIAYSGGVFSVRAKNGRDMSNDPMVMVSWYGSVAYCNWRSQQEGKEQCYNLSTWDCDFSKHGYRLATEAEWEYGARGGLCGRRFPWGDTISHSLVVS